MKSQLKFYLTSALMMIVIKSNFAQPFGWAWAKSSGGIGNDYSNAVCTDASGNVYATGTFQGSSIIFGSNTLNNVGTGALDIFIVKYDVSGNVLWSNSGGGIGNDYSYGTCVDTKGNVYIAGYFRSPYITFGTTILNNIDSTGNSVDIFITKYDSIGTLLWAKSVVNSGWEMCWGICSDKDNNVYITGMFESDTLQFGNITLINHGYYDVFIAKYDTGGNVLWAKNEGGIQWDAGTAICSDANKNIYVTGNFQTPAFFSNDTLFGDRFFDTFVAKYDSYGNKLWAKSATGPIFPESSGTGICADVQGNVYITGYFRYSLCFGSDTLSASSNAGIYIAKYDASGNAQWGRTPGGTGYDYGTGIASNANGNVFVTGHFESSFLNFGGIPILNSNVGYDDIFVAGYDSSGNALWAKGVGGQDYDYGMGICSNTSGDVYVTGYFGSYSLNFGSTTVTNSGSFDIFVAKLFSTVGIDEPFLNKDYISLILYPNPTTNTFAIKNLSSSEILLLQIINPIGEVVFKEELFGKEEYNFDANIAKGIYFVRVSNGKKNVVRKLIIE